jgi:hypothetical protein
MDGVVRVVEQHIGKTTDTVSALRMPSSGMLHSVTLVSADDS